MLKWVNILSRRYWQESFNNSRAQPSSAHTACATNILVLFILQRVCCWETLLIASMIWPLKLSFRLYCRLAFPQFPLTLLLVAFDSANSNSLFFRLRSSIILQRSATLPLSWATTRAPWSCDLVACPWTLFVWLSVSVAWLLIVTSMPLLLASSSDDESDLLSCCFLLPLSCRCILLSSELE